MAAQQGDKEKNQQWGKGRELINRWSPWDLKGSGVISMTLSRGTQDVMHLSKPTEPRQHQDRVLTSAGLELTMTYQYRFINCNQGIKQESKMLLITQGIRSPLCNPLNFL